MSTCFEHTANMAKLGGLTLIAPVGAVCGLYVGVPRHKSYFEAIDPDERITPSSVCQTDGVSVYHYKDIEAGVYHCAASLEGHVAFCKVINYTEEKARCGHTVELVLDRLSGNGYEGRYIMENTDEFYALQLKSEKDAWGKEYEYIFNTPQFLRRREDAVRHKQTTNEELCEFIEALAARCEYMHTFSLGKSPKYGFDMPLAIFTHEDIKGKSLEAAAEILKNSGKPTVHYTAQVHGNEPISCEGALATMLALAGELGKDVLDRVNVYIIPRINPDGAFESIRETPATKEDLNRDYVRMNNAEIRTVVAVYNMFLPEVALDGHEKGSSYNEAGEARCTDIEVQVGVGSLNHPKSMNECGMDMALNTLRQSRELGLRAHFYTSFASAMGGAAGSSYYGARNSISFLVETPGNTALGMQFLERRVLAQYVFASSMIRYTADNASRIMETVHESREKMKRDGEVYREENLVVLEHERVETGNFATPIIHVPTGEVIDEARPLPYDEHAKPAKIRTRPTAYAIPMGLANEKEILKIADCHAIKYYALPEGTTLSLCQYEKRGEAVEVCEERAVLFEKGAYVFTNNVPSIILSLIFEPDFNMSTGRKMTLFSMGLIDADEDGKLPVYRYIHDLKNGKI